MSAGNLILNQTGTTPSFTNTGTITIATGLTWTLNGGALDLSAGTTSGAGVLAVNSATFGFTTSNVTTLLTFAAGTVLNAERL